MCITKWYTYSEVMNRNMNVCTAWYYTLVSIITKRSLHVMDRISKNCRTHYMTVIQISISAYCSIVVYVKKYRDLGQQYVRIYTYTFILHVHIDMYYVYVKFIRNLCLRLEWAQQVQQAHASDIDTIESVQRLFSNANVCTKRNKSQKFVLHLTNKPEIRLAFSIHSSKLK